MTRSAVHGIVKEVFNQAANRWLADGRGEAQAERLRAASSHWLRHTAGTSLANAGVNLSYVRDTLGHSDLSTTSIYVHGEDDARHDAVNGAHRINWNSSGLKVWFSLLATGASAATVGPARGTSSKSPAERPVTDRHRLPLATVFSASGKWCSLSQGSAAQSPHVHIHACFRR